MAANNEEIIDLTCSFTLVGHYDPDNVIIDLETDESFHEEINNGSDNIQRNRNGTQTRNRRRSTVPRVNNTEQTSSALTSIPQVHKKRNCKSFHKKTPEEPKEKKAKLSLGSCPICWDEFGTKPLSATKCGHVFCTDCITLALKDAATCPQCRAKLRGAAAVHPLYIS